MKRVGGAAHNSGQYPVSPATLPAGSRERLDRPAAYTTTWVPPARCLPPEYYGTSAGHYTPRLDVMPIPFGEFYAAVFGGRERRCVSTGGSNHPKDGPGSRGTPRDAAARVPHP